MKCFICYLVCFVVFVNFTAFFLVMNQYTTIFVVAMTLAMKDKDNRNGAI